MSFTLLFTKNAELHALEAQDYPDALISARDLITRGALDMSIINPFGKAIAQHQDILQAWKHIGLLKQCEGSTH